MGMAFQPRITIIANKNICFDSRVSLWLAQSFHSLSISVSFFKAIPMNNTAHLERPETIPVRRLAPIVPLKVIPKPEPRLKKRFSPLKTENSPPLFYNKPIKRNCRRTV
jgi:hypothetical protein